MRTYETVFIVTPDLVQEDAMKVFEKFKEIITSNGGEIINDEFWGKLRMAYEIEDKSEGYYFLIQFNTDKDIPAELETKFKYDESVIRSLVIKIDGKKFKLKKRSEMTQRAPRRGGRPFRKDSGRGFEKDGASDEESADTNTEEVAETGEETREEKSED